MIKKFQKSSNIDELIKKTYDNEMVCDTNVLQKCNIDFIYNPNYLDFENDKRAPSIALIDRWTKDHYESENISIYHLHNPYLIGGIIKSRKGRYHEHGQLLLTNDLKLTKSSFCPMDGNNSLPMNIISNYEDGNIDNIEINIEEKLKDSVKFEGWHYFIGNSHRHFGHFFLEALPRLWALQYLPKDLKNEIKFIVYEDDLKPFMFEFFALYGINRDKIISVKDIAVIENLILPDLPYRTHRWISKLFSIHIQKIKDNITIDRNDKKIFLSRSGVGDRPLKNRKYVEDYFKDIGYDIIHPEEMSVYNQIKIIMESSEIAGEVGSQMYLSVFAEKNTKLRILAPQNFYLKDDCLLSKVSKVDLKVLLGSAIDFNVDKDQRSWEIDEKLFFEFMND